MVGKMKIILYPSANPDRHGPIGKVIEVDPKDGNAWVGAGIARVIEHDKPEPTRPAAVLVEEQHRSTGTDPDDENEQEDEQEQEDDDTEPRGDFLDER